MKYSEYASPATPDSHIPGWEERLKARQESLAGKPHWACLVDLPASVWERKLYRSKLIVAAMCLAENDECAACLKLLRSC